MKNETVTITLPKKLCVQLADLLENAAASEVLDAVWLAAKLLSRAADNGTITLESVTVVKPIADIDDIVGTWTAEQSDLTRSIEVMLERLYPRRP